MVFGYWAAAGRVNVGMDEILLRLKLPRTSNTLVPYVPPALANPFTVIVSAYVPLTLLPEVVNAALSPSGGTTPNRISRVTV